ncbi:MAG: ParB/RepB/Spo0J family partition protein [Peptoniphilaceae bacterium]|nr:ParB/RepB/Spo0J family partition protein [Peptoniphilaceae bacterium]MDY6018899.1 ParB/RepB/Spo0J family partition protein [Anaerococcus sp.]
MNRRSLGRGLNSLIPDTNFDKEEGKIKKIPIADIRPRKDQPRKNFDGIALQGLSQSIKQYGLLNPIVVTKKNDKYEIVAGERRYRASKLLGLEYIDAVVKEIDSKDLDILSIVENIQREDLSAIEEANAYQELADNYHMTQEAISKTIGKSRSYIANTMRLLKLDDRTKDELEKGNISSSQARTLLAIDDLDQRMTYLDDFLNNKTNIRKVEEKSKKSKKNKKVIKEDKDTELDRILFEDFEEKFINLVGTKVNISKSQDIYKVTFDCFSIDDIENLYRRLNKNDD